MKNRLKQSDFDIKMNFTGRKKRGGRIGGGVLSQRGVQGVRVSIYRYVHLALLLKY
jgi:hypothetical protein